jgi:pyroglutamyl-peptidase
MTLRSRVLAGIRSELRLLVTGFGPFPGAPENPTETLVRTLAEEPPEAFAASAMKAVVLPTDYQRSWPMLRGLYSRFEPDVVVHFGLNGSANAIHIETVGVNLVDQKKPDASGYAPRSGRVRRGGPEKLFAMLPAEAILAALKRGGIPAQLSDDAGDYVCNATLYRSLYALPAGRTVGFIHVPPNLTPEALLAAAHTILRTVCSSSHPGVTR